MIWLPDGLLAVLLLGECGERGDNITFGGANSDDQQPL